MNQIRFLIKSNFMNFIECMLEFKIIKNCSFLIKNLYIK